jgi:tellurite resistance protein
MKATTKKVNVLESFSVRGCQKEMTWTRKNFRQAQTMKPLVKACDTVSIGNGDVDNKNKAKM